MMASTVTHTYFVMDVFNKMPIKSKEVIQYDKDCLKVFGQSMDALYFYNIHMPYKGKRIRAFAKYFHENKSQDFFINLIEYIKYNKLMMDGKVMTFLYGALCHYVLDSTIHPFVIYKSKIMNHGHSAIELYFDNYLIMTREKIKGYQFNLINNVFYNVLFTDKLKEVINYSFKETFDINNMSKFYEKSIKEMTRFYKFYRQDNLGVKFRFYSFIDFLTREKFFKFKLLSYHYNFKGFDYYLNKDHLPWYNPLNKRNKKNLSFDDIFNNSVKEAVKLIKEIDNYLYSGKKIELKKLFPNLSYISGLDCKKKLDFKYFEI